MKRQRKIMVNAIRCKVCGETLNSRHVHDFVPCKCFIESGGTKGCACDGGLTYMRRVGEPDSYEDLSVSRLFTEEERDEYNQQKELLAEQYGWENIDYME